MYIHKIDFQDISSNSPQLWCSPDGLSSPESSTSIREKPNQENNNFIETSVKRNSRSHKGELSSSTHDSNKSVTKDKKVFCYYCESYVLHFPRHISRNHRSEIEVQKILSLPPLSEDRKRLLFALRKKGNYLMSNTVTKPVRKGGLTTNYLPCSFCLGFYSSKSLWRHRKQCSENPNKGQTTGNSKSEAQNLLLRHLRIDPHLKSDVFPRMRGDNISLLAKKDPLICAYASRYLKIHRERHFITVATRKMRELAKLLNEIMKIKSSITDLFGALKPENYDLLVSATKAVAKYDVENQVFKSPTYALNMGTTLKQCCDIALMHTLKKSECFQTVRSASTEAELKTLSDVIKANWKFDISSQASTDLQINKLNKVSIVPLASDLKLLKEYLVSKAKTAFAKLQECHTDIQAYVTLLETVYCRLVLLNRRRPGELQRLSLQMYISASKIENSQGYQEFSEALSETEKILTKSFKRIVIRGKRGRGVPVLFNKEIQEQLDLLIKYRSDIIQKNNIYLFCNPNSSEPIVGYKVLRKYALLCGSQNPDALTSTRLRKHLATLTQLFNMNENDMEQLASFMGHTLGIHRSSYRLPDDVYQTAKISKLLVLMEKGEAGQFKGKSLDDINLDLEEDLLCDNNEETGVCLEEIDEIHENESASTSSDSNKIVVSTPGRKQRVLVRWTEEQKEVVTLYFKEHIKQKRPPRKIECEDLISKNSELLKNKDWLKIKVFIQNKYSKKCN